MIDHTAALFRQAQIHMGMADTTSPAGVALATLKQAFLNLKACLAKDPSIRFTLPVPTATWDVMDEITKAALPETPAKEP